MHTVITILQKDSATLDGGSGMFFNEGVQRLL